MNDHPHFKNKTVEEIDFSKYQENTDDPNPYLKKYGSKLRSQFSHVQ